MNPWGFVVLLVGAVIVWVGVRGTQGSLYADIFGQAYPGSATVNPNLSAGSSIGSLGPHGISTQGSSALQVPGLQAPIGAGALGGISAPVPSGNFGGGTIVNPNNAAGLSLTQTGYAL